MLPFLPFFFVFLVPLPLPVDPFAVEMVICEVAPPSSPPAPASSSVPDNGTACEVHVARLSTGAAVAAATAVVVDEACITADFGTGNVGTTRRVVDGEDTVP